jgi:hypothetical protein
VGLPAAAEENNQIPARVESHPIQTLTLSDQQAVIAMAVFGWLMPVPKLLPRLANDRWPLPNVLTDGRFRKNPPFPSVGLTDRS